jgi:signal transduction histidine kinase
VLDASSILAQAYKLKNQKDSTIKYLELSVALNDKLFNQEKQREIQNLTFNEQNRLEEIEREREQFRNQLKLYGLLAFGVVGFIVALLLWRNNLHRKRAYTLLQTQKQETDHQRSKAEQALHKLKATQTQLIQSEKMASLGELTAGIAHEIQNPLNFVNNFSELNTELFEELKQEIDKGDLEEAKAIVQDLKENEQKIMLHGKRADMIVKSMLQHSRTSSGEKQATDLNTLADEYLRLAYHGLRAKEKDFNAEFLLEADPQIGKVEVVPQEIGRVLLNLFNNAFYATQQKKAQLNGQYQPQVTVTTKATVDKVEIRVRDNGTGIPESVQQKIFQPFFTTKPTGEGTGLGLSLSYDIISKGHGGELNVESKEGEFTEFIITLPHKL